MTTVFVGNISDRAPDSMIRQMLQVGLIVKISKALVKRSKGLEEMSC